MNKEEQSRKAKKREAELLEYLETRRGFESNAYLARQLTEIIEYIKFVKPLDHHTIQPHEPSS